MKVVLKHNGRWLHFQCPEKVLIAECIDEVMPAIAEAERSGLYAAGFISYEAAPAFDAALKTHPANGFPLLMLGLFNAPEVLDEIELCGGRGSARADSGCGLDRASPSRYSIGELKPSVSKEEFKAAIGEIKERIAEGATYQVNYTYRLNADFLGDAWAFFNELVKGQKTEYAAFIETDDFAVCSASPELFFSFGEGEIISRPMKGTARRGLTFSMDCKQAEALRRSEKDRAENIMIVDMIRNDIGRVATPGSVETVSTFDVEKYPTVWQMTSTVTGTLLKKNPSPPALPEDIESTEISPLCSSVPSVVKILKSLFPCASITGAPKAKTMEIIQSLETSPRRIYTGSIGFITPQGEAGFNVAIRTALIQNGRLEFGVGGGIVWDSDAESEYEETLTKARVLTQSRPDFQLLETMLWEPESGIFLLNEHLQRLAESAAFFDIPLELHPVQELLETLEHTCAGVHHRVRLLVSRDGEVDVQTAAVEPGGEKGLMRAAVADAPVDSQHLFLYHKTTHRDVYENAKAAFPDYDEVILWNEKGEVTEGTFTNVVISRDGKKITPPVECGLLAGTFREYLLKTGEVEEGIVMRDELKQADNVWLVNSVRKWQNVVIGGLR
ncbi:bifunctional chorismate-binding protein/class IV aminotransferase [Pontiella agarivorans]|uniref:Chorismate-binding protein n=1 Tax=Pontiella agarivorans TaxID=3038953 RepID=A0ABU5MZC8_9BACT|nr:chorismate-binding protein [Pontiella agarivorans]MDZ8119519.1 chorismate-binding protein [Pontiella agarivorans]